MKQNVTKLLENDSSFQLIQPHNDSPCGLALLDGLVKVFRKRYPAQTKERNAYEIGAKIYYELGFKDGQNECAIIHKANNVNKEDYDFLMKLLSMMGLSYFYTIDIPLIQKEAYKKATNIEPKMPFHPGLNLIQSGKNYIPADKMTELKTIVNTIFDSLNAEYYGIRRKTNTI